MKITIAGGDLRMITAGKLFAESGYECCAIGFGGRAEKEGIAESGIEDSLRDAKAVILPLPCEKDGFLNTPFSSERIPLRDIFSKANGSTLFIGGKLPQGGESFIDYSSREDFQLKNAVPTAEGAIALAMKELQTTLFGANALIVGYGRIGRYLASALKGLGAKVYVVTRSLKSRALAEIDGMESSGFDKFDVSLSNADIVFNTVPFIVMREREISVLRDGVSVIDLASLPGGVDEEAARVYGVQLIHALALPGKVAPKSAGRILFETVTSILREKEVII